MLPVVRGTAETTRQILLYTILLVAISLIFFAVARMGLIYLVAAVVMGAIFLWQAAKLNRRYFRDLHYRQGRMEAIRRRGEGSRVPPNYFYGQLVRAIASVWSEVRASGRDATLRKEMNVAYFLGQIVGWSLGPRV